ncbi:hypothetical protein BGZ92_007774 [Podila epicladia]|nr:hypothetical protein BGZ92_007774 [Podila epicladia]
MVDDLTAATPSNDKDPKHALGTTDPYTMTTEHAELYQKLIRDLIETVPTNDKVIETAQCRMLMATYDDDLLAHRLENILRNATDTVSIVFYNIMKGNYYRHMAKYLTNHDKHKKTIYQDQALSAFMIAKKSATSSSMSLNDPIYLELHISLANLYYLMGMYRSARITNAWAYDALCECKDQLDEEDSKLSASINERMRKLMNRWTDEAIMGLTY